MQTNPDKDTELRIKINRETSRLPWAELERHFAAGSVVWISDELDLVDVAVRVSHDDKASISEWMRAGRLSRVSDQQALRWTETQAELWAVVVSPFVLVQQQKPKVH